MSYVLSNLTDNRLNELGEAVHKERKRRFNDRFDILQWPLPSSNMTTVDYVRYLRQETQRSIMECTWAAYRIMGRE